MTKKILEGIVEYTVRASGAQNQAEKEAAIDALATNQWVKAGAELAFAHFFQRKQEAEATAFAYAFASSAGFVLKAVEDLLSHPDTKGRELDAVKLLGATGNVGTALAALQATAKGQSATLPPT